MWETVTVRELINQNILFPPLDGNHGEIHPKSSDFVGEGIPFIMAADIDNVAIDFKNCKFITERQAKSLRKGFAKTGDVLLTHKATIGKTALIKSIPYEFIMLTPQVTYYRVKNHTKLDNRYLKFYFSSSYFQELFSNWAGSGGTRAYLGILEQQKLPIILPPLSTQQKIAEILSAYDDLIENNNHRIELLEQAAQQIYKEWFVRFRFPGYETARFTKGIPNGWEITKLSKLVTTQYGYTASAELDIVGPKFLRITDIAEKNLYWDTVPYCKIENKELSKYLIEYGDILVARTGATVGYAKWINKNCPKAVFASFLVRMKSKVKELSLMIGMVVESQQYKDFIQAISTGAAQPQANAQLLTLFSVMVPDENTINKFNSVVEPMRDQIELILEKNLNLIKQRDLLLSRLMSGKLEV